MKFVETLKQTIDSKSILLTVLGAFSFVFGIKGFLLPDGFLAGGMTGIALLINQLYNVNFILILIVINLPFILFSYFKLSKAFALQTVISLVIVSLIFSLFHFESITTDPSLVSAFGGFFMGLGLGLVMRSGGTIDGIDLFAVSVKNKLGLTKSELILGINSFIFLIITYNLGLEKALYAILTYIAALKMSDYVVDGFEEFVGLSIISTKPEVLKKHIVNELNKPITVYKGERGYLPGMKIEKKDCDIITVIITRLELHKIQVDIFELDPKAFMYINSIKTVKGGIVSKKKIY